MNRQLQWLLELSSASWSFTGDYSLNINLNLDGRVFRGRALAREGSTLQIEVDDPISLFATLRLGSQLRATAGGLVTEFDLTDTSEVLAAVAQCAVRGAHPAARATARTRKEGPAPAGPGPDAAMLTEASRLADAIRTQAAVTDFQVLGAVPGLPGSRAAIGWKAISAGGVVAVFPTEAAASVTELSARVREIEKQRCRGEYFFISTVEKFERGDMARLYVACKMTESTSIAYYFAVPRPGGGAYLVSNTSGQGFALTIQRQTETVDERLRALIPDALRRAGQKAPADRRPASGADGVTPELKETIR